MREKRGFTQETLSEKTGLHRVTIAKYETMDGGVTLESAIRLANALKCTVEDLYGKETP